MTEIQDNDFAQVFVGRTIELEQFERAINPRGKLAKLIFGPRTNVKSRVFLPHGIGGIGKSFLSKKCLAKAKDAGWATIEIDWDRVDIRPSGEVELMNVVAEELKTIHGEKVIQEYLRTQRQIKQVKDRIQKLKYENQEKWQNIFEATQNIIEGIGGEEGKAIGKAINGIGNVVNLGADLLARAEDSFVDWLVSSGRLKGNESTLYKDEKNHLTKKLVSAIGEVSNAQPLAILFDTCEALSLNLEEWQRDGIVCPVVSLNKPIIFIVSGRQDQYRERQADSGDNKIRPTKGYADRLTDPPPISWDVSRFADPEIKDYLHQHGFEANSELVDFVQQLAKGVPYAVQLLIQAFKKLGIEYVKSNFPPKDLSTFSAQEMVTLVTERFLRYCLHDEGDLEKIQGLAILQNWDAGGLRAIWNLSPDIDASRALRSLQSRYSFILPERKLHEIVRDFLREELRGTDEVTARDLGSRLSEYYSPLWKELTNDLPILLERVTESRWRQLSLNTLNALCWHDEDAAIKFLVARVVETMTFNIRYADSLLELVYEFSRPPKWFSNKMYDVINVLRQIVKGGDKEELSGLATLINESSSLLLEDRHLSILFLWRAQNLLRTGWIKESLGNCIEAKERLAKHNDPSISHRVAQTLNIIGWRLGFEGESTKASQNALAALIHAVDIQPDNGYLHVSLGVMQFGLDMNEEAVKSITYGMGLIEENASAYNWLGAAYFGLHNYDDAIAAYKKSIQLDAKKSYAWNGLAHVYKYLGQLDDARKCYDKVLEFDPNNPHSNIGIIDLLWRQGRIQEAIDKVNDSITLNTNDDESWYALGYICRQSNKKEESKSAFMRALDLNKESGNWNGLGNILRDLGELEDAAAAYKNALELIPDDPIYKDNLANVYFEQGDYALAIDLYSQMIASNQKSYGHVSLAMCYFKIDDLEKANEEIKIAQSLVEIHPLYIKARLYAVKRDAGNAIKYLNECLTNGTVSIAWIKKDPVLEFIRDSAEFLELVSDQSIE